MEDIEEVKEELKQVKESFNAWDFSYKVLDRNAKRERFINKLFFAIIVILLLINAYFAYVFTTTTVMDTEQQGIYNFYDSEGNAISSDLSLEEMKELVELNGEYQD